MLSLRAVIAGRGIVSGIHAISPVSFLRVASTATVPATFDEERKRLEKILKEDLPKPYDGPERDLVNFPKRKRALDVSPVRFGFLPDEWFTFFYKKTGVTGPYLFGAGLITFLLSKELYVFEEEFSTGMALMIIYFTAKKKFGKQISDYVDKEQEAELQGYYKQKEDSMKNIEKNIEDTKLSVWQVESQKILMNAKRENVQMQLETEYRRRMMHVYEQVKKRLDYHLELVNTRRKLEQKHMVDWIVNNVVKSITPQQEKEALQKCIEDLKTLSLKAH